MMPFVLRILPFVALWFVFGNARLFPAEKAAPANGSSTSAAFEFFETKVRPILVQRCHRCHGPKSDPEAGLRLDSLAGMLRGGRSGPAILPGKPRESLLILAINHDTFVHMPPKKMLPREEIANLTAWVQMGAPWPNAKVPVRAAMPRETDVHFTEADRSF
jgi:hypothetical protein